MHRDKEKWNAYMREYQRTHKEAKKKRDVEFYQRNKTRLQATSRQYHADHREERKAYSQEHYYQTKYGISVEDKQTMFKDQHGLCYLCGKSMPSWEESYVEHNHVTDEIRGLAHPVCNTQLGVIETLVSEDINTLNKMLGVAGYLDTTLR
jgi:hypothetical protein